MAIRRYRRTVFLAIAACATLVWAAVDQFGIPLREIGELFLQTVLAVTVVVVAAGLSVAVWLGLRRLLSRDD